MRTSSVNNPLLIFLLALIICGQNIWGSSIYILDEAKNATCAREMIESPDHIVPTFNYGLRTDKPSLHYYFMMLSYQIFEVNEFAARFFSSFFGALTVLITFLYTRKLLDEKVAFIASFAMLSSTHFALQFHLAVPDPYLVFFITLAGFAFVDGYIHENLKAIYLAYVAIGLGVLAKGPVAIALPGLAVAAFILLSGRLNWETLKSFRPFTGLLLAISIALPWYLAVSLKTDWEWTRGFFLDHNIDRFADPKEGHGGKFWLTPVFVIGGMLPTSAFIIQAFRLWWAERMNDFLFFCGLFALIVIVFFSISSTKLPNYTVPAYPFLAVLIGHYLQQVLDRWIGNFWFKVSAAFVLILMALFQFGMQFGVLADDRFAFLSQQSLWLIPVTLAGLLGCFFLDRGKLENALAAMCIGFVLFTAVALNVFYPKIDAINPVTKILPRIDENKPIAHYQRYNPAFSFYLKKPIPKLETIDEVEAFFADHSNGILLTRSDFSKDIADLNYLIKIYDEPELFEPKRVMVYVKRQ